MAHLPYMQLYVADYLADTMHLTTEEHGAYMLLLMNYWQTAKPLPKSRLKVITRLSNDRWIAVEDSLKEFFHDDGKSWIHRRVEADLKIARDSQKQRIIAGKASAESRKKAKLEKEKAAAKPMVEGPANDRSNGKATTVDVSLQREHQREGNGKSTNKEQNRIEYKNNKSEIAFETFWKSWPDDLGEKGNKKRAHAQWDRLKPDDDLVNRMRSGLDAQVRYKRMMRIRKEFSPNFQHVERWIRDRGWENTLPPIPLEPETSLGRPGL